MTRWTSIPSGIIRLLRRSALQRCLHVLHLEQHKRMGTTCSFTSTHPRKTVFQRICRICSGSWTTWRLGSKQLPRLGTAASGRSCMRLALLDTRAPTLVAVMDSSPTKARIACCRLARLASATFVEILWYAPPYSLAGALKDPLNLQDSSRGAVPAPTGCHSEGFIYVPDVCAAACVARLLIHFPFPLV